MVFGAAGLFAQCDTIDIPARQAKQISEVVFRGTVTDIQATGLDRTVIFQVSRVWKGPVGPTFEMLALEGVCLGFPPGLLTVGNELMVYASRQGSPATYFPLRQMTTLVSLAKGIKELGPGHRPRRR